MGFDNVLLSLCLYNDFEGNGKNGSVIGRSVKNFGSFAVKNRDDRKTGGHLQTAPSNPDYCQIPRQVPCPPA